MPTPTEIAQRFAAIDAHDDTAEGITFRPAAKRGSKAKVEVVLFRHWRNTRRLVTFTGCANYEVVLDSDVFRDNAPNNTCSFEATAEQGDIEAVIRRQRKAWNVSYERSIDPMPKKLANASKLVLFRIRLFGGILLVVARSFTIKRLTPPSSGQPSAAAHLER